MDGRLRRRPRPLGGRPRARVPRGRVRHRGRGAARASPAWPCAVALHLAFPPPLVALLPSPDMHELHPDSDTFRASAVALTHGGDIYDTPAKLRNLNPPVLAALRHRSHCSTPCRPTASFVVLTLIMVVGAVVVVARELRLTAGANGGRRARGARLVAAARHAAARADLRAAAGRAGRRMGLPNATATRCSPPRATASPWRSSRRSAPLLLLPLGVLRRWRPGSAAGFGGAAAASLLGVLVAGPASSRGCGSASAEPVPDTADNASLPGLAVRLGLPSAVGTVLGLCRADRHGQAQHGADRGRQPQAHRQTRAAEALSAVSGTGLGEADPQPLQPTGRARDEHAEQRRPRRRRRTRRLPGATGAAPAGAAAAGRARA